MPARPRLELLRDSFPQRPALDTALSHALLRLTAQGELPATLRLHRPGPSVAFGRLDALAPGYPEAVAAARSHGFEAIERLAGGRAAVYHEDTVGLALTLPDSEPAVRTYDRFAECAGLLAEALRALGVDARVGAVPGEYCAGDFSVNARGRSKLVGIGQKLVGAAAHVGGVTVATGSARVRDVLVPVYAALGISWDSASAGSVADELPGADYELVEQAIARAYGERYELVEARLDPAVIELAERLEPEHLAPGASRETASGMPQPSKGQIGQK